VAALRDAAPFAAFYAALFFALGVLLPFWPVYLEWKGLGAGEIGLLLALGTWAKAAANPVFGNWADRSGNPRRVLTGLAGAAALATLAMPMAEGFWPLVAAYLVLFPCFQALIPLGDSRALGVAAENGLDYGRMRLWGSLAFLVAVLGVGELLDVAAPAVLPWVVLGAFVFLMGITTRLPTPSQAPRRGADGSVLALFRSRRFALFLAVGALLQASHAVYYGFSAVHWTAAGLSPATVGWLWAEGVVAEILLFAVSGRVVTRLRPEGLLALAAAGGLLRWTVLAGTTALPALIAVQGLHAATFGAAHLGAMHFIFRWTRETGGQATAQGVYTAVAGGIGMGLAMLGAGALFDAVGGQAFAAMAVMSVMAGVLLLWLFRDAPQAA
jgi:PPP family 3-phenylpropionic acid transporter